MFRPIAAAALAVAGAPSAGAAQAVVQPLGQTDADLLAAQIRRLAAEPRDLYALATAGELSIKLGDLSGAAALFARADRIDPRNGRVKAGMGSILVRSERPGEALRFFQQAEQFGWAASRFAADRGLAYDLVGDQPRAQRDYRTALAATRDDETVRRYALSLGISGRRDEAVAALDPLVRRQDRAAWRARAFVLAMGGDTAGAAKIATTMMPAGMAGGLAGFFQRLPSLSPADRAFAVHFGEVNSTPQRLADARLAPVLPSLTPEPVMTAPVRVAVETREERRRRERLERQARRARGREPAVAAAAPTSAARQPQATPVRVAAAPGRISVPPTPPIMRIANPPVQADSTRPRQPAAVRPVAAAPVRVAGTAGPAPTYPPPRPAPVAVTARTVLTAAPDAAAAIAPAPVRPAPVETSAVTQRADAVLARIVASLSIPASELGIAEPVRARAAPPRPAVPASVAAAPASSAGRRVVAEASAKEARDTAVRRTVAARLTGDAEADDAEEAKPLTRAQRRAAEKKALAEKAAAEKKAARGNPSRIWVQVAGGANKGDLGRAWTAVRAKASALADRTGYTASERATNRVLTGPFKTAAEARALVNQLARQGVSAFAFTSAAGQEVTRLATR